MGDRVLKKIAEYLKAHRWKKNWQAVLTSLAAVVVFCTTYALILPAITLEKANVGVATQSDADSKTGAGKATPSNAVKSTTVSGNDPEEDGDLIFDLDYDLGTRRSLTRGVRNLGIDVDMGVPEWMLSDWDDVPSFDGELTGNWSEDLLAVAESQVGYMADSEGKSYYGDWYGKPYDDWDAMFISYCLDIAEVPEDVIPRETSAAELADRLANMDTARFLEAEAHTPMAGELIFLDTDGDGEADRVGIVAEYNARTGELKVIEGDYRTEVEHYETEELASPSNAEKATPSDAKKAKPGRGGGIGNPATPSDAKKVSQKASPLGSTIEKKETILLTEAVEKEDEDETEDTDEIDSYDIISEAAIVSYDLEELLSGEENVSVVGYGETVMLLGAVEGQNIVDYAAESSDRSLELLVANSDGVVIGADNDGNYYLTKDKGYYINLAFGSTNGMDIGTYYYAFPGGLTVEENSGTLYLKDQYANKNNVGSWEVILDEDDGYVIIFTMNENIETYVNVTLDVKVSAIVTGEEEEINIGGTIYIVYDPNEDEQIVLKKEYSELTSFIDEGVIGWTIYIIGCEGKGLAGETITDTIPDTTNHCYTEDDINDMRLYVTDNEGEQHRLFLSTDVVTWSENQWEYKLPDSFVCGYSWCSNKTVELPTSSDGSAGWSIKIQYTSTLRSDLSGYTVIGNQVKAFDQGAEESVSFNEPTASIGKNGSWYGSSTADSGSEENIDDAYISWSIDAWIPGTEDGEPYKYGWQIYDQTSINGNSEIKINNMGLGSSDIEVTATLNGETVALRNVGDINAGDSDTIAWDLLSDSPYSSIRTLRLWSKCTCEENTCGNWSNSKLICNTEKDNGFCRCWCIKDDVTITITYKTSVVYQLSSGGEELNLIEEHAGDLLRNSATLQYQYLPDGSDEFESYDMAKSDADVDIPEMLTKDCTEEASSLNGRIVQYTVTFNDAMVDLSDLQDIAIVDTMTYNQLFLKDSMEITATNAAGDSHKVTEYTVEYVEYDENASDPATIGTVGANVAIITINPSELGPYKYTIIYNAALYLAAGSRNFSYTNKAEVEVYGKQYSSGEVKTFYQDVVLTGEYYSIFLEKTDKNDSSPLAGAIFNVCNVSNNLMAKVETSDNGPIEIGTDVEKGIHFYEHTLYYLQEAKAPDGYVLDDSKHYFWFCNEKDNSECAECTSLRQRADVLSSGSVYYVCEILNAINNHYTITITNTPGRKLPESGGTGTLPYTMAGMLLTGCACLMYKNTRRKRGREKV
ncbi:MAG: prealbumin-like fold domain-containing protein [Clostridiales bacterium]|nr:prealbumin-like fold domain-containing protein [Clostridiales bacterium]